MFEQRYSDLYQNCQLCPRLCQVNRTNNELGYCNCSDKLMIASICQHFGEEPVLGGENGVLNIFFSHCNLQCVYCQNYQISRNSTFNNVKYDSIEELYKRVCNFIENGVKYIGFVTPTHFLPHLIDFTKLIKTEYPEIITIYNTNAYENTDNLKLLEGLIDIYLPDFKYSDDLLAEKLSNVKNYTKFAIKSIKEMVRQKGTSLICNENGLAESGVIVRHLILPYYLDNSINVLKILSEDISFNLHISLMAQYNPINEPSKYEEIQRKITIGELKTIENALIQYGFFRGWTQDLTSSNNYNPDFKSDNPFK